MAERFYTLAEVLVELFDRDFQVIVRTDPPLGFYVGLDCHGQEVAEAQYFNRTDVGSIGAWLMGAADAHRP